MGDDIAPTPVTVVQPSEAPVTAVIDHAAKISELEQKQLQAEEAYNRRLMEAEEAYTRRLSELESRQDERFSPMKQELEARFAAPVEEPVEEVPALEEVIETPPAPKEEKRRGLRARRKARRG